MKNLKIFALSLTVLGVVAQATSLHPDTFRRGTAPVLSLNLDASVSHRAEVLKRDRMHPYTKFVIGIDAAVNTGSACVAFAGQATKKDASGTDVISLVGATDALNDICIAIMPEPVKTKLTVQMNILTGGFVPAANIQRKRVVIGNGVYEIVLNMGNESVTVKTLARPVSAH